MIDRRRVVGALRVRGAAHEVAGRLESAGLAGGGAGAAVAVQHPHLGLAAAQLRPRDDLLDVGDCRLTVFFGVAKAAASAWRCIACDSGLASRQHRCDQQQDELDRRDEARDEGRGPPGADQHFGCGKRRVHSATRFRYAGWASFVQAQVSREPVGERHPRRASRARARPARRRAPIGGRRRAGPLRGAARSSLPATARTPRSSSEHASCRRRCRRCTGRPSCPTAASAARDDVGRRRRSRGSGCRRRR